MRPAGVGPEGTDPADTEPVLNPDQAGTDPVARCEQGLLRGRHRRGVQIFAGIGYAAPPVGPLRFRAPEPHESWEGERDAHRFGPAAPQLPGEGLTSRIPIPWDEDCLTLNVVTPACDDALRPVYVWIHGGGFLVVWRVCRSRPGRLRMWA